MRKALVFAIFAMAFAAAIASPRHHRRHRTAHPTRSNRQLQTDLTAVRGKKAKLRAELRLTKKKAHAVKVDLNAVDAKLDHVKDKLADTRSHLGTARVAQRRAVKDLAAANRELAATRDQVRARLRYIYMQGHLTGFSAIAGTQRAGDLASRSGIMNVIERKDHELFVRYVELQHETDDRKHRDDELVAEIGSLAREEQGETRELADVRMEKGQVLEGLRVRQDEIQDEIRQFDADEAEIASEIRAYARAHMGGRGRATLPMFTGRFSRPVNARITSYFGMRYHPILHVVRMHTGIDFGAPIGTPIHAAADGIVIATTFMRGYGHVVIVDHGGGISTVYAHTSQVFVSPGQRVLRGMEIAAVGNSGLSTGPHLHFEVRVNGHPVNPLGRL